MQYGIYGQAYTFYAPLPASNSANNAQVNPTLAAGDFTVIRDGVSLGNMATLPDVFPAGGRMVRFQLSATEMTGKAIIVQCVDAAGAQWGEAYFDIGTINHTSSLIPVHDSNVVNWKGTTAPNNTGDSFARLGAPVGASISADISAVDTDTGTIVAKLPTGNIADNATVDTVESSLVTVLADTTLIKGYTDTLETAVAAVSTKIDSVATGANLALVKADTDTIKGYTDTLESSMTTIVNKLPVGDMAEETTSQSILAAVSGAGLVDVNVVNWKGAAAPTLPASIADKPTLDLVKTDTTNILAGLPSGAFASQASVDAIQADVDLLQVAASSIKSDTEETLAKLPAGAIADKTTLDTVSAQCGDTLNNTVNIVNRLPTSGTISNLDLDGTLIDGVPLRKVLELLMGMVDGKFVVDQVAGTVTFFKRNDITPLTIVRPTTAGRTRQGV